MTSLRSVASSAAESAETSRPPSSSRPRGGPVEAAEQVHQGRLAGAGRPDDGHVVARLDPQRHPAQGRHATPRRAGIRGSRPRPRPGRAPIAGAQCRSWPAVTWSVAADHDPLARLQSPVSDLDQVLALHAERRPAAAPPCRRGPPRPPPGRRWRRRPRPARRPRWSRCAPAGGPPRSCPAAASAARRRRASGGDARTTAGSGTPRRPGPTASAAGRPCRRSPRS